MPSPLKEHWSEFDWERELRKDDERVNVYFRELPKYIDLPGEEEMIYRTIQRRRELAPHGVDFPEQMPAKMDPREAESPEMEAERKKWEENWQKREGAAVYIACGRIARALGAFFAEKTVDAETEIFVLQAQCLTGKIMARVTDILEMEPAEMPALRIALCKRLHADFNKIIGLVLDAIPRKDPECVEILGFIRNIAMDCREEVLRILDHARKIAADKGKIDFGDIPF